jgi:hypothetical protein
MGLEGFVACIIAHRNTSILLVSSARWAIDHLIDALAVNQPAMTRDPIVRRAARARARGSRTCTPRYVDDNVGFCQQIAQNSSAPRLIPIS